MVWNSSISRSKKLSIDKLQRIQGQNRPRVAWYADFNAHSAVWGLPLYAEECHQAVRERNRAFRLLKITHTMVNLIQYERAQAEVSKTVTRAKRETSVALLEELRQ